MGGAHLDTKAHLLSTPRSGSSNPATVTRSPGGVACNVARNLARLGADVILCSVAGDDVAAVSLRSTLSTEGVEYAATTADRPTASYLAVLDPSGGLFIGIADMEIYDTIGRAWAEEAAEAAEGADLWVVDANLPRVALEALVERSPVPVVGDPVSAAKAVRFSPILNRLTVVFPDRAEAAVLAGGEPSVPAANAAAMVAAGAATVVVSLGGDGAVFHGADAIETRPAITPDAIVDVTGAGDALVAGYTWALAAGEDDPLAWGMAAASFAVETDASVSPELSEENLRKRLSR